MKARLDFLLTGPKTVGYIEAIRIDGHPELFGMTHRLRWTIRDYAKEKLSHDMTDQQITQAPSSLTPQLLMDMVLCDARAYSIKFTATRKKFDNADKIERQQELDD